jgi:pyridinium-3,5-biscarboxylic acid mononucleotide sulfurtransferase
MVQTQNTIISALNRLEENIQHKGPLCIAVSGGVDSMTLAYIAHRINPERLESYAERENWQLTIINAREMEDLNYLRNPVNRCYFCKSNLYSSIGKYTQYNIVSGTNTDDLNDYRPGLIAASENNVSHPYVEVGIDKKIIRGLAKHFSLSDLEELPASPCLSSRVSTGLEINPLILPLIDQVENKLRALLANKLKLEAVRCRIKKDHISIQLDAGIPINNDIYYADSIREEVNSVFRDTGFEHYCEKIFIEPYVKGSAFISVS